MLREREKKTLDKRKKDNVFKYNTEIALTTMYVNSFSMCVCAAAAAYQLCTMQISTNHHQCGRR